MKDVVIVAESSFVIETIRLALRDSAGLRLLGKLDGRESVRREIAEHRPEIALIDELEDTDRTLGRIRECREEAPSASILLLSMRMDDHAWVARVLDAGVDACLSKATHLPALGGLIREITEGNVITARPALEPRAGGAGEDLTAREREILVLVAEGRTNARIAGDLWITEQTVKFHLSNTYRKLGVSNRTEASRYACDNGLATPTAPRAIAA